MRRGGGEDGRRGGGEEERRGGGEENAHCTILPATADSRAPINSITMPTSVW